MRFIASLDLLMFMRNALAQPVRRNPYPRIGWAQRLVKKGWISQTELFDSLEMEDPRLQMISDYGDEILNTFELPLRYVNSKPRSILSDIMPIASLSAVDTAALMIYLECLGFTIASSEIVKLICSDLNSKSLITDAELSILFYDKLVERSQIVLSTKSYTSSISSQNLNISCGRTVKWRSSGENACLHVEAACFRTPRAQDLVTCSYCGTYYDRANHDAAVLHRESHRRYRRVHDPKPIDEFLSAIQSTTDPYKVTCDSPMWANTEMYERAHAFKREMKYDNHQWTAPNENGQSDEDGVGYLLVSEKAPTTIAGACAFRQRSDGWTLDWIWIAPKFRRSRVLESYWKHFFHIYGDFGIEYPLSAAMQSFVLKNGSSKQICTLRKMHQY